MGRISMKLKLSYNIAEVVEITGIGRSTLYVDIAAKRLVAKKCGSRTVILANDLAEYLDRLPRLHPTTPNEKG